MASKEEFSRVYILQPATRTGHETAIGYRLRAPVREEANRLVRKYIPRKCLLCQQSWTKGKGIGVWVARRRRCLRSIFIAGAFCVGGESASCHARVQRLVVNVTRLLDERILARQQTSTSEGTEQQQQQQQQ